MLSAMVLSCCAIAWRRVQAEFRKITQSHSSATLLSLVFFTCVVWGCGGVATPASVSGPSIDSANTITEPSGSATSTSVNVLSCIVAKCTFFPPPPSCESGAACDTRFVFWYENWQSSTLKQLSGAQVMIGVPTAAISDIHQANGIALPYVTYYQSADPGTFILNRADLPSVGFYTDGQYLQSTMDSGWDVLCPNSSILRQRVAAQLNNLIAGGYNGLFIDNTIAAPAASATCTASHAHVTPEQRGDDSYLSLLAEVRSELLEASPNAIIITNPGNPAWADQLGTGAEPSLWQLSDLVLWESYGYGADLSSHDNWQATISSSYQYAADPAKAFKILALSYPQSTTEALFSFAIARMFGFRWTANLGVNGKSGHFGEFASAMPYSVGVPQGPLYSMNDLLARYFSNGIAFANSGASSITITVPQAGQLVTAGGTQAIEANATLPLPSHTAAILLFK